MSYTTIFMSKNMRQYTVGNLACHGVASHTIRRHKTSHSHTARLKSATSDVLRTAMERTSYRVVCLSICRHIASDSGLFRHGGMIFRWISGR